MSQSKNSVFIATSIDGFIADIDGNIDWLDTIPDINKIDTGYNSFVSRMDAIVMGRVTFETVLSFDIEWPYQKPVFVISSTLQSVPKNLTGKVHLMKGPLLDIIAPIHEQGYQKLYIDGGRLIQGFLKEDQIHEMIITVIPVLLGGGFPLFAKQDMRLNFKCINTKLYLDAVVQNHFVREK